MSYKSLSLICMCVNVRVCMCCIRLSFNMISIFHSKARFFRMFFSSSSSSHSIYLQSFMYVVHRMQFSIKTYFQLLKHDIVYMHGIKMRTKKHIHTYTQTHITLKFICSVIELNVSTRISITQKII